MRQSRAPTPPEALDDIDCVDAEMAKWREQITQMQLAALREARGGQQLPNGAQGDGGGAGGAGGVPGVGGAAKLRSRLSGNTQFKGLLMAARFTGTLATGAPKRESVTEDGDGGEAGGMPPGGTAPSFAGSAASGGLPPAGGSGVGAAAGGKGGGWGAARFGKKGGGLTGTTEAGAEAAAAES